MNKVVINKKSDLESVYAGFHPRLEFMLVRSDMQINTKLQSVPTEQ